MPTKITVWIARWRVLAEHTCVQALMQHGPCQELLLVVQYAGYCKKKNNVFPSEFDNPI